MSILVHEFEIKVFNRDQRMSVDQFAREFVPVIAALMGHFFMQSGHLSDGFEPAFAALLAPGHFSLSDPQLDQRLSQPARMIEQVPCTGRQQGFQAHVDPDGGACRNPSPFRFRHFKQQANRPLLVGSLDHNMLDLCRFRNRSMIDDFDLTDVLEIDAHLSTVFHAQLAAIPITILDTLEALAAFEAREPWGFSRFQSAEESRKGFVQSAQHLLDTRGVQQAIFIWVIVAFISEMRPLILLCDPFARFLVGGDALFQGSVVQASSLGEQAVKGNPLLFIGT